jgi:membrane protein
MTNNWVTRWFKSKIKKTVMFVRRIVLPGFGKVPLYDVGGFYMNGIANGAIGVRASGIAFNFFMAMFPSLIFLFTLIPYIPIPHFQTELIVLIEKVLPANTYHAVENTILDITTHKRGSLLSFGFLAALFFSTNGISAMIAAFNASANSFENRRWVSMRLVAIMLVIIIFVLITFAIGLIIFGQTILTYLVKHGLMQSGFSQIVFISGQWLIILAFILISLSFLYYYAPSNRSSFRFFSPGAVMATILIILTSLAFSYYLGHFGKYNKLYGSIGTLLALLIWLNINSFVLLIGFELNVSIHNAHLESKNELELSENSKEYERFYPIKDDILKDL